MKLTVLVDNQTFTDEYYLGEPGLSYYLEIGSKKILFDLGFSAIYLKNAQRLRINLKKIDFIVLSHGHNDHTQGLKSFPYASEKIKLISHPDCLLPKYVGRFLGRFHGSPVLKQEAKKKFDYIQTRNPYFIIPNIVFLGEIKEKYSFEKRKPIGFKIKNGKKEPDLLLDDSALAVKTKKGVVIITGCSHSGICNIVAQAKKVFGIKEMYSVIGGFHLRGENKEKLKKQLKF